MNKKVLVAAIGAALIAGPIAAQAGATVYGLAHMSLDMLSADRTSGEDSSNQIVSNSSRFGIKADEDLGGGLKAEVKYELLYNGFGETTGSTLQGNRDNYIGLSGGFGALRVGTIDGAVKDAGGVADLFYREQLGESRSIINAPVVLLGTKLPSGADNRVQNGIHYFSPSLGGWTIKAQYGFEAEQIIGQPATGPYAGTFTDSGERTMMQIGAKGKIGPVALGIGYLKTTNENQTIAPFILGNDDTTVLRVGAKMNFGGFDIAALYQTAEGFGGVSDIDQDAYGVGVGFKSGNHYFKGQYYIAGEIGGISDTGATMLAVGWDYLLSKTTTAYITYAKLDMDSPAPALLGSYSLGGNGHGTAATSNVAAGSASGLSIGMIMNF